MSLWAFDIETDTTAQPHPDGTPPGLDPRTSRITAIAVAGPNSWTVADGDENYLLATFLGWLARDVAPDDVVATWNGGAFDWPYVAHRCALARVKAAEFPFTLTARSDRLPKYGSLPVFDGVARVNLIRGRHLDVAFPYREWCDTNHIRWSLKPTADAWGIDAIVPGITGSQSGTLSAEMLAAYCLSDARSTRLLAGTTICEDPAWLD